MCFICRMQTVSPMTYSLELIRKIQRFVCQSLILLSLFVFSDMSLPVRGWAQSFADTGSFYFSGNNNPLRRPIFREFLPGDGVKAGPARVHAFLGVAEAITDNVFRSNTRRRTDFLTTIAPGIQVNFPFRGKHAFLLDYRATQFYYAKFTGNNVLAQHGVGHLKLDFGTGLKVDLQGGHIEGFDSRGSDLDTQQTDITRWATNSFLGRVEFLGPNVGVRLRVIFTDWNFKNNGQSAPRDRNRTGANLTFFIPATRTTSGLLGFGIVNRSFDENKQLDSFGYRVFTGFRLRPSRLLSGELRFGYTVINFDRAPVGGDLTAPTSKASRLLADGLNLGGRQQKRITLRGNLIWKPTSQWMIRLRPFRLIRQAAIIGTSTLVRTGVSLAARKALNEKLQVRGRFSWARSDFEEGRLDDRFRWRIGLGYKTVKWLGFGLDYTFEKRVSNSNRFDYYGNTIVVSVQAFL